MQFTFPSFGSDQNIVIFGHTHKADLKKSYILARGPGGERYPSRSPLPLDLCQQWRLGRLGELYCTYVETQEDADAKRHNVRLMAYPSKMLQEGFVKL